MTDPLADSLLAAVGTESMTTGEAMSIAARAAREHIAAEIESIGSEWDGSAEPNGGPYEYGRAARKIAALIRGSKP